MYSLLLTVIYASFISLGLPDSLLGSGWPSMYPELSVPLSYAGIISTVIAVGTVISSLLSDRLTKKWGAGGVTAVSVLATAVALFGFSVSPSFISLCIFAVPYGLGAGAVDAALNNYVALHYSSRHMSWLHAFWGVGVSISPYVMGFCLSSQLGWRSGYGIISAAQFILTAILFLSLPLWKKRNGEEEKSRAPVSLVNAIKIRGVTPCLVAFLCYCGVESTAGLWATSFTVGAYGLSPEVAARFGALFYLGETGGRFLSGFIADRMGDKRMIYTGSFVMLSGIILLMLPACGTVTVVAGLLILGLGAAPIYPCVIHSTPESFGRENSQALVGIQMASAYLGNIFIPPLFGIIADYISVSLYPFFLGLIAIGMLCSLRLMYRKLK